MTIRTFANGDPINATDLNNVRSEMAGGIPDLMTTKGDLVVATAANTCARLGIGTNGYVLTADSAQTTGIKWALDAAKDLVTTKGDLLVGTAADTLARLGVGPNGSILVCDSSESTGLRWRSNLACNSSGEDQTSIAYGDETWRQLYFYTEDFDIGACVTNADTFTAPVSGKYLVYFNGMRLNLITGGFSAGDYVKIRVVRSSTEVSKLFEWYAQTAISYGNAWVVPSGMDIVSMTAGQTLQLQFAFLASGVQGSWAGEGDWGVARLGR